MSQQVPQIIVPTTVINVYPPIYVEYRTPAGTGVRVVRVRLNLSTPQVSYYIEHVSSKVEPMWLFLDEIGQYVIDAKQRLRGAMTNVPQKPS